MFIFQILFHMASLTCGFGEILQVLTINFPFFQEQLRDLMFYMEAQNKIAESPMRSEIEGGEVVLTEDPRLKQEHKTGTRPKRKSSNR